MPRFSNRPFLATTLSFLSSRAKPRDLRCAIRVPRCYRPTTATNHHQILMETSPLSFRVSRSGRRNRRSLHYATPDFLWKLVTLANIMRLSLTKGAHAVSSSAARQEIRVRSGRDDNSVAAEISYFSWKRGILSSNKFVISTGGVMGLRPTQVMKNASVRHPRFMEPLPFPCHPDRSGGTCGSADPSWRCFSTDVPGFPTTQN